MDETALKVAAEAGSVENKDDERSVTVSLCVALVLPTLELAFAFLSLPHS